MNVPIARDSTTNTKKCRVPLAEKPKNLGIEWDAENRLVRSIVGQVTVDFSYDAIGRRTRAVEKQGSVTMADSRFLWAGTELAEERDSAGTSVVRRFQEYGVQEGALVRFSTRDHLRSIRETSDTSGGLVGRYDYDPYGRISVVSGSPAQLAYTGQHALSSTSGTGLYYYKARYYDPALGRFLSEDPIRSGKLPAFYAYVDNNPTNAIDPYGLQAVDCDDCNERQQNKLRRAFKNFCARSKLPKCQRALSYYGLEECIDEKCKSGIKAVCIPRGKDCGGCGGPCNVLSDPTETVFFQPAGFTGLCGDSPVARTMAHEMAHMCGIGPDADQSLPQAQLNLRAAQNVEESCYSK